MSFRRVFILILVLVLLLLAPTAALAQDELPIMITVAPTVACGEFDFEVTVEWGMAPYSLAWEFGDGESLVVNDVTSFPHVTSYIYQVSGDYEWTLTVVDSSDPQMTGIASGKLSLGPAATINSTVMPPIFVLDAGQVTASFTAEVSGGSPPFTYAWNFEGASDFAIGPDSTTASATYTAAGKFNAGVTITDACGFEDTDTLTLVVIDSETSCHPMAQRIADAVNTLFPNQAEQLYTCEDIFGIFQGDLTGSQVGFGRLWKAYQISLVIEDLTWEEIRDWHLDGTGWGLLVQLDRFAEALEDVGITDLIDRVLSGENSINDIRTALRAVTRYEAGFEEALTKLANGASPGELGQFYRLAQELAVDPEVLDGYLEMGISLPELRQAGRLAEKYDSDLEEIVTTHAAGHNWGEIGQAFRLAGEDVDAAAILEIGVQEYRDQLREGERAERDTEQNQRTAAKIAGQFGVTGEEVKNMYEGTCNGDWSCVRAHFREQTHEHVQDEKNQRTAARLAAQYGMSEEEVMGLFSGVCEGDWNCVRSHLRNQVHGESGKGKKK